MNQSEKLDNDFHNLQISKPPSALHFLLYYLEEVAFRRTRFAFSILIVCWFGSTMVFSQSDSIIFHNGNFLVGDIKSMNRNVLKMKTTFSDSDFAIEWNGVKEIFTQSYFLITLSNGNRYNGTIQSSGTNQLSIVTDDGQAIPIHFDEIVFMEDVNKGFWSQIYASIDFGFDLTKANSFKQYSMRSNLGYMARRWQLDANYNALNTYQDNVDDIQRDEGGVTFKFFLPKDWYPLISLGLLSNTEQNLNLRSTGKLGMGKFLIHTNKTHLGLMVGVNFNVENYNLGSTPDRESWEGFFGSELYMFNIGDFNLLTQFVVYPSFTESRRWRSDFRVDGKYDLPLDFYVKLGLTLNYDNRPANDAPQSDYVFRTGFGWEW